MPYKDKAKRKKVTADRREYLRKWYQEYKSHLECETCGESESCCLVFHHVGNDKKENISTLWNRRWPIDKILDEMSKCIVLCSNCHMKLHAGVM